MKIIISRLLKTLHLSLTITTFPCSACKTITSLTFDVLKQTYVIVGKGEIYNGLWFFR